MLAFHHFTAERFNCYSTSVWHNRNHLRLNLNSAELSRREGNLNRQHVNNGYFNNIAFSLYSWSYRLEQRLRQERARISHAQKELNESRMDPEEKVKAVSETGAQEDIVLIDQLQHAGPVSRLYDSYKRLRCYIAIEQQSHPILYYAEISEQ